MELAIVARRAVAVLEDRGLSVERAYIGTFLSALEMAGVSLSVLRVDDAPAGPAGRADRRPGLAQRRRPRPGRIATRPRMASPAPRRTSRRRPPGPGAAAGYRLGPGDRAAALARRREALIDAAPRLTELDQAVGDGDLGISLAPGAQAVVEDLAASLYPLDDPAATLHALGLTLQGALGGTSGALYAVFFLRAAARLRPGSPDDPAPGPTPSGPAPRRSPSSAAPGRATGRCSTP